MGVRTIGQRGPTIQAFTFHLEHWFFPFRRCPWNNTATILLSHQDETYCIEHAQKGSDIEIR